MVTVSFLGNTVVDVIMIKGMCMNTAVLYYMTNYDKEVYSVCMMGQLDCRLTEHTINSYSRLNPRVLNAQESTNLPKSVPCNPFSYKLG